MSLHMEKALFFHKKNMKSICAYKNQRRNDRFDDP